MSKSHFNNPSYVVFEGQIAGIKFHTGKSFLPQLTPGTKLSIYREPSNPFDKYAVMICIPQLNEAAAVLGYIPATHSQIFSILLRNDIELNCYLLHVHSSGEHAKFQLTL